MTNYIIFSRPKKLFKAAFFLKSLFEAIVKLKDTNEFSFPTCIIRRFSFRKLTGFKFMLWLQKNAVNDAKIIFKGNLF
jgi:hypothetical protein